MTKQQYTFVILRYVHDPLIEEFVNVGLAVYFHASSSEPASLRFKARHTIGRFREMYPDLKRSDFSRAMKTIERSFAKISKQVQADRLNLMKGNVLKYALNALPKDDSGLQWSSIGSGLTKSSQQLFDSLYHRFITKYDEKSESRRSDEDVWRPVHAVLQERKLKLEFEAKRIKGSDDQIEFKRAWKNGKWQVYEPLSFDLADAEGIYKKAHRWLGQLTSVAEGLEEEFLPHFIVGAPQDESLLAAHDRAVKIIQKAPIAVEVFKESEIHEFVDQIESCYQDHSRKYK